jgi:hypothetical protein
MRRLLALPLAILAAAAPAAATAATRTVEASAAARLTLLGAPGSGAGSAVARLGDLNGDGRPDLAIGAPFASLPGRPNAGVVYVVLGSSASGAVGLDALGTGGFRIEGGRNYRAGFALAAAGDVNGDGRPDLLLSAPRKNGYKVSGSAFVVYGKADAATVDLAHLSSAQGFEIVGTAPNPVASAEDVAGPGDVDGDGHADVLVTTAGHGAALVYGAAHRGRVDLRRGLGARGFRIVGTALPSVAAAGDVDADGRPDLLLGAAAVRLPGRRFPVNSAFVVFGRRRSATVDLRRLGSRGVRIGGLVSGRIARPAVAGVGDLNGDRRADLLVVRDPGGAPGGRPEAAVVFGSRSTRTVDLGRLGARGFRLLGPRIPGGFSVLGPVAGAGDLDGDGIPDLALAGSTAPAGSGGSDHTASVYVVLGRRTTSTLALADLGAAGLQLVGPPPPTQSTAICESRLGAALAPVERGALLVGAPGLDCAGQALIVAAP